MFKKVMVRILAFLIFVSPICLTACGDKSNDTATLKSISSEMTLKNTYFVGDSLELDNYKIKAKYSDGSSKEIEVTESMVSGFDTTTPGEKVLTITYSKKTMELPYTVITPAVTSIELKTAPTKTTYFEGEDFDVAGGVITATYENEQTEDIEITAEMISGFTSTASETAKTLTITYQGKTTTLSYQVSAIVVTSIKLSADFKYDYFVGDALNVAGGKLEATKNDGGKETINISQSMISDFNTTTSGSRQLTITYQGFTVKKTYTVQDIVVTRIEPKTPFELESYVGDGRDKLNLSDKQLNVYYNNDPENPKAITITKEMISNFDTSQPSTTNKLIITYQGKTCEIPHIVKPVVATAIEIVSDFKYVYFQYETLDLSNGTVKVSFNNGTSRIIEITESMISNFKNDPSEYGTYEMDITYESVSIKVPYTIQEVKVNRVELVNEKLSKTKYYLFEPLDISGEKLKLYYNDPNKEPEIVDITENMVIGFSNAIARENKEMTIRYKKGLEVKVTYSVLERSMEITTEFKLEYNVGDSLDIVGGQLTITYADKDSEVVSIDSSMISGFNTDTAGTRQLTITYQGLKKQVTYVVS